MEISQNIAAFSEYMNFTKLILERLIFFLRASVKMQEYSKILFKKQSRCNIITKKSSDTQLLIVKLKNQNMIRLQLSYEKNFDFLLLYVSKNSRKFLNELVSSCIDILEHKKSIPFTSRRNLKIMCEYDIRVNRRIGICFIGAFSLNLF